MGCLFQLFKSLSPQRDPAEGLGLVGTSAAEIWPSLCQRDTEKGQERQTQSESWRTNEEQ